jgi:hypothetical protein
MPTNEQLNRLRDALNGATLELGTDTETGDPILATLTEDDVHHPLGPVRLVFTPPLAESEGRDLDPGGSCAICLDGAEPGIRALDRRPDRNGCNRCRQAIEEETDHRILDRWLAAPRSERRLLLALVTGFDPLTGQHTRHRFIRKLIVADDTDSALYNNPAYVIDQPERRDLTHYRRRIQRHLID